MKREKAQEELQGILDSLGEEILNAPPEEILELYKETGFDPDEGYKRIHDTILNSINSFRRKNLTAAREGYNNSLREKTGSDIPNTIQEQRELLESICSMPNIPQELTLRFRDKKKGALSDDEVKGVLEDLEELGFLKKK